jgi:hypothetical protein
VITVNGADEFARLSRQLKEAGQKGLQREFTQAISRSVKPLKAELPASARTHLPRRGGLAERVAGSRIGFTRRTSGRGVGLRVQAKNAYHLAQMDKGFVRHPVFKRRGEESRSFVWVTQRVIPGWFTDPTDAAAPRIRREVLRAMDDVARKINAGL